MPATPPSQPPSFTPGGGRRRPDDDGARAVGPTPATPSRRPPAPYVPASSSGTKPPAIAPPPRALVPGQPRAAGSVPADGAPPRRRLARRLALIGALLLVVLLAWPIGLLIWSNGKIHHLTALSGAPDTPGTTYLLAGSDSRADGTIGADGTTGARTDTIMVLHVPTSGPPALISLPRDSYVPIPGHGSNKLNASFSWGGAPLLVRTVEALTGLTIDHYVEIGFSGVEQVVTAVGGVQLCLDYNVADPDSGLNWKAGCRLADGPTALSFARMRYADPTGDIGRGQRQRQIVSAVTAAAAKPSLIFQPSRQVALIDAGTGALTASNGTDVIDLARFALAFRDATGPKGITGTPPIKSMDYRPGNVGSTVQLDPKLTPVFFQAIKNGTLPPGTVGGAPK